MDLEKLKKTKMPILILGETGTGKTQLAKSISVDATKFIQLNVSSLSHNLFESELFGHIKGAFTGSTHTRAGFCEEVDEGVLFLDEIGELSLELQVKLLTLIDEKLFYPVGSSRPKKFRGRLIVATNKDLRLLVNTGKFRSDLYYRLRLVEVRKRPLRFEKYKRKLILDELNNYKVKKKKSLIFEAECLNLLLEYSWPGNYRELKNTIEYIFDMADNRVTANHLPAWINEKEHSSNKAWKCSQQRYREALEIFEKNYLSALLKLHTGKINKSAQAAGISKVTLISKLKKYGIKRTDFQKSMSVDVG